jgi:hypothetical protein
MPNKFPVFKILETKPFLFLKMLLVDGLRTAIKTVQVKIPNDIAILQVGDSMGPFKLTEVEKPFNYLFTLNSFFFNCRTGYILSPAETKTILNFVLFSDDTRLREKLYWFFVRPIHRLLAQKALKVIRDKVELMR